MIAVLCIAFVLVTLLCSIAWVLGGWAARALEAPEEVSFLRPFRWLERLSASVIGSDYKSEMTWKEYFFALLAFHTCGILFLFLLLRWQGLWQAIDPLATNMNAYAALNAAISFATNTNWQSYIPETQMSWPVQMIGLTVQNFLSAAVGVAVSTERGLMVPVLRDCDRVSFADIEKQLATAAQKAREAKMTLADLEGGVFTITNGGVFGSLLSTPILNAPQCAILGMHAIQDRPVAVNGQVVIRPMMYLALSYDHRIVDGREAVTFLVKVKQAIEASTLQQLDL